MKYQFPKNFFWGAACASHQWEGGLTNDWTEWEQKNANDLIKRSEQRLGDWQKEKFPEYRDRNNYISGVACDHYQRFEEDYRLAKDLGWNAVRISIAWERIEPKKGEYNAEAFDHYLKEIESMRQNGIEPFVTLWHWPIPLWLRDEGGWENPNVVEYFAKYGEIVIDKLHDKVKFWTTINEPWVYVANHYYVGGRPPAKKNIFIAWSVYNRLAKAHNRLYDVVKKKYPSLQFGVAHHMVNFRLKNNNWINQILKQGADWLINYKFLDQIKDRQDYIGLNYYQTHLVDWSFRMDGTDEMMDIGWKMAPEGVGEVICDLWKKYQKPIYILENGLADADDKNRQWYLSESLKSIYSQILKGADVRGYLHWSFMDNFEWDSGFWPRFGLIEIDRKTLERKPRKSAYWYRDVCKNNGF